MTGSHRSPEKSIPSAFTCLNILKTTVVLGLSEFQWQPPKRNDKADRKKNRLWQISAVFCWNILKGETKGRWGGRGAGVGFKVGDGAKLMAWKHTSACMETHMMQQPSPASATERMFVSEDGGLVKRCITHPHPTFWQICPSWCHLFVILNWQRAQKARVLHKPYPVWLCAEELIPPKTLIDILPWCRGICGAPAAKPTAGQSGRLGYLYMRSVWGLHKLRTQDYRWENNFLSSCGDGHPVLCVIF